MIGDAVCCRCGGPKEQPWETCARCHFSPLGDDNALIRSVYLSVGRYAEIQEQEAYRQTLGEMAARIENGESITIATNEAARLKLQLVQVRNLPANAPWGAVARMFAPALLTLVVLLLVFIVLRCVA